MATTEEKITGVEKLLRNSEELSNAYLIKITSNRLKELQDQLQQERKIINI